MSYVVMSPEQKNHINHLRFLSAKLRCMQSSPGLSEKERKECKDSILALNAAIDALQAQVLA